jgi:NAD(P)-dependent dehydrogenase (short-subunit alcohol dehydrogenase family)
MAETGASARYRDQNEKMYNEVLGDIPRRRLADPEIDVGGAIAFLAGQDSAHVTGMTFFVDGGAHINGIRWRPRPA